MGVGVPGDLRTVGEDAGRSIITLVVEGTALICSAVFAQLSIVMHGLEAAIDRYGWLLCT